MVSCTPGRRRTGPDRPYGWRTTVTSANTVRPTGDRTTTSIQGPSAGPHTYVADKSSSPAGTGVVASRTVVALASGTVCAAVDGGTVVEVLGATVVGRSADSCDEQLTPDNRRQTARALVVHLMEVLTFRLPWAVPSWLDCLGWTRCDTDFRTTQSHGEVAHRLRHSWARPTIGRPSL